MFVTSTPVPFFDYWRVPYSVAPPPAPDAPIGTVRAAADGDGPLLAWPDVSRLSAGAVLADRWRLEDFFVVADAVSDADGAELVGALPGPWRRAQVMTAAATGAQTSVWTRPDGSLFLPFDPGAAITALLTERYAESTATAAHTSLLAAYYRLRGLVPRRAVLAARRLYARRQALRAFPGWPVEPSLHSLYGYLFGAARAVAGEPVPFLQPWPDGYGWALVLTHDVDTARGVEDICVLRDLELELGYRSSWNFVPERYPTPVGVLAELRDAGFEIGVHGLLHDGRDLSPDALPERLPRMRGYARRWGAVGFRSPSTLRDSAVMPRLGFDYDSSYPDTDPFEPHPGGCGSWLPYLIEDMVELPITLVQDHTLLVILRRRDAEMWRQKTEHLRHVGGMALVLTHPDYVRVAPVEQAYRELLRRYADDPTAWHALPRDVASWWRERSASQIVRDADGWRVHGPAARRGRVRLA